MNILLVQGHPDASEKHFCHAIAEAYAEAARQGGHEVRRLDIGTLDFSVLRSRREWESAAVSPDIARAQQDILWSRHIVLVFPLWLGEAPALLKAFFEQVMRPGFAVPALESTNPVRPLAGRSAHLMVTMGMPAAFYRIWYRAHGLKNLKRNMLNFVGIKPVRLSLFGVVEGKDTTRREKFLTEVKSFPGKLRE